MCFSKDRDFQEFPKDPPQAAQQRRRVFAYPQKGQPSGPIGPLKIAWCGRNSCPGWSRLEISACTEGP